MKKIKNFQKRKENIKEMVVQIRSMKRVLWAMVEQEGGEYTIRPDIFEEAHTINAGFDAEITENGAFFMKNIKHNKTVEGNEIEDEEA